MWSLHDRLESTISEHTCKAEIDSFDKHGQLVPVMGRPLRSDADYDVELIFGARRLFVARQANKPLAVELREISDMEAIVAMDIENRQRADISPYERGLSYARWLRESYFGSQDEIARTLRVSSSQVSRLLKIARLPPVIVNAFRSPAEICEGWGLDLVEALSDASRRQATVLCARAIANGGARQESREVYRQLMSASAPGRKLKPRVHDEVVKARDGAPLFRVRHQTNAISLMIPRASVSVRALEELRRAVAEVLQPANVQVADSSCSAYQQPGSVARVA